MSIQCEIQNMIEHYEDMVESLNTAIWAAVDTDHDQDGIMLVVRKSAYEKDIIPDLKKLLAIVNARQTSYMPERARIILKTEDGEVVYGEYDFNTPMEKDAVNELAMKLRKDRKMGVEVRKI